MVKESVVFVTIGLFFAQISLGQPLCSMAQITDTTTGLSFRPSLDRERIAFLSDANLAGENQDGSLEVFLFDGSTTRQITDMGPVIPEDIEDLDTVCFGFGLDVVLDVDLDKETLAFYACNDLTGENPDRNFEIFVFDGVDIRQITDSTTDSTIISRNTSVDSGSIAFTMCDDLTGDNSDKSCELYLFDGSEIHQITDSSDGDSFSGEASLDGDSIAFISNADLTAKNPDRNLEIFLFDGTTITQVTSAIGGNSRLPSLDGGAIAFSSDADLTGDNPDGSIEIFLFDGTTIRQVTNAIGGISRLPSLDGGAIAFSSDADLTEQNPEGNAEIFLFDEDSITQITDATSGHSSRPRLEGGTIAFDSSADLTGGNPDGSSVEIFLASCVPSPPEGPFLVSDEIPGFRFKVRITAGDQIISGHNETDCIAETLCVSGALPGRSELFLRMIGPRPNGFLWTNLVRFTPSRVEVWAEQVITGQINYYDLSALPREDTELTGLVDKQAFLPEGAVVGAVGAIRGRPLGAPGVTPLELSLVSGENPLGPAEILFPELRDNNRPNAVSFTSDAFPGYRFTVRIFSADQEQPVQVESDCIAETICVSGALAGRSELFLRIIGPRPNGFLWVNLVRFTTSRVEVEIEQLASGLLQNYVLSEVPRQSDELPGRVDKEAFLP